MAFRFKIKFILKCFRIDKKRLIGKWSDVVGFYKFGSKIKRKNYKNSGSYNLTT